MIENVATQWFDEGALRLPPYKVGRVNYGKGRGYIKILEGGILEEPFRVYASLTTAISQSAPMAGGLLEWYCKHGYEEARRLSRIAADYGTLMHQAIGDYIINHSFDFDIIRDYVADYCRTNKYTYPETREWVEKLRCDLAAYIQFHHDYKVKPLAVEHVMVSDTWGFGTLIDLVCDMEIEEKGFFGEVYKSGDRKGEPKESKQSRVIRAVVNFKSGRHGFYHENGLQIMAEKRLFEENFPDLSIEGAFNWSPKDWRGGVPTYNLKDWTGEISEEEVDLMLNIASIRFGEKALDKKITSITGMSIEGRGLSENMVTETVEEFCKRRYSTLL